MKWEKETIKQKWRELTSLHRIGELDYLYPLAFIAALCIGIAVKIYG